MKHTSNDNTTYYLDPNILHQLDNEILIKIELLCKTLLEIQDYELKGGSQFGQRTKVISTGTTRFPDELDRF